jgi:diaminohydroxyphosphoribosylaminopyrimidine deaminase/5-amino-6-(5-phosphoribosylamino)uracil reductase
MMTRALGLAARGLYTTDPNPRVGCVLAQGEQIVGEGWTSPAGGPHAEVNALRMADALAAGATAYVTLEPCSHHGRTPPCADALIKARVKRVVAAVGDPNPLVNGAGRERLRAAGIEVVVGLCESEARELNVGFFKRMTVGMPWVTVKIAASLDGRIALWNGVSRWITGSAAREDVQHLRARASAVLTGMGTVLADDPQLTVRSTDIDMLGRRPLRVILDSKLRTPPSARLFKAQGEVLLLTGSQSETNRAALQAVGANIVELPLAPAGGIDLHAALKLLAERHCNEVIVEAGPTLAGRFIEKQLVDELVIYLAPTLLGHEGRPMMLLPRISEMSDRSQWRLLEHVACGEDLRLRLRPQQVK